MIIMRWLEHKIASDLLEHSMTRTRGKLEVGWRGVVTIADKT
jgi:hypothetical protein